MKDQNLLKDKLTRLKSETPSAPTDQASMIWARLQNETQTKTKTSPWSIKWAFGASLALTSLAVFLLNVPSQVAPHSNELSEETYVYSVFDAGFAEIESSYEIVDAAYTEL